MVFEDIHRPLSAAGFRGAVRWIICISGAVLILEQFYAAPIINLFGLVPQRVWQNHWAWQVLTYSFLHGGLFHWLFNMFILWMFGRELEIRWGTPFFLWFYFLTASGAALCILLLTPHSMVPTIGASGAIFGFLAAFAMVYPDAVLYLYFVVPVKAWHAVIFFAIIELFASMEGGGAGLSRFAHLGGMATGYLYLKYADPITVWIHSTERDIRRKLAQQWPFRKKRSIIFHEATDDLVSEVDRILDKILKEGVDSLSPREKEMMDRYSKMKL